MAKMRAISSPHRQGALPLASSSCWNLFIRLSGAAQCPPERSTALIVAAPLWKPANPGTSGRAPADARPCASTQTAFTLNRVPARPAPAGAEILRQWDAHVTGRGLGQWRGEALAKAADAKAGNAIRGAWPPRAISRLVIPPHLKSRRAGERRGWRRAPASFLFPGPRTSRERPCQGRTPQG
jgi:hypothetical protein